MRKNLVGTIILLSFMSSVFAQDLELRGIDVRSSRLKEVATQSVSDIIVMDSREIMKKSVSSVFESLFDEVGIDWSRTGTFGTVSNVYIRGGKGNQVLFMFEDIPLNDPMGLGTSQFARVPPIVDRMEILKGPQSIIYGSNAMSGLIYLGLDRGRGKPVMSFDFLYGERDTVRSVVGYRGSLDRFHFNFRASFFNTKNFDITRQDDNIEDVDFSRNSALTFKVGYVWNKALLDVFFLGYESGLNFDNCNNRIDARCIENVIMNVEGVKVNLFPLNNYNIKFTIGRSDTTRAYGGEASSYGKFRGIVFYSDIENYIKFSKLSFSFGGSMKEESGEATNINITRFRTNSVYSNVLLTPFRYWQIQGGIRYDDSDTFRDKTVYKAGSTIYIKPINVILYGSYATAYRTPNIFEFTQGGTQGVKPEESKGYQAGLKGRWCRLFAGFGIYETFYENLIDYDTNTLSYKNLGYTRAEGKEVYMGFFITKSMTAKAFFSDTYSYCITGCGYLKPKEQVPRIPREKWGIVIKGTAGRIDTNLSFVRIGERNDMAFNGGQPSIVNLKGYSLFNAYIGYRISDNYKVYVQGINLLDEKYEEVYGYNTIRRSVYAGVEVRY